MYQDDVLPRPSGSTQEEEFAQEDAAVSEVLTDIIIVGSGPAGLATAIAARRAELTYQIVEKGVLVNSLFHYPTNMVFFTTPDLLEIGGLPFTTPFAKPTRAEALIYYRRVCDAFNLKIAFDEEVRSVGRLHIGQGRPVFSVTTRTSDAFEQIRYSRYVVMATGYYDHPNLIGVPGENLPHVSHYYTESHGYYRKRVVVIGGKNSAAEASLDLHRGGAHVTLVHRGAHLGDSIKYWVRPDIENRIKEGSIAARFNSRVLEILPSAVVVDSEGERHEMPADAVFLLTGYHPDVGLLSGAGVCVDRQTCVPAYNPETLESDVPGLFLAGAVVSGRDGNSVFIENGRFHGEKIIRIIQHRKPGPSGLLA